MELILVLLPLALLLAGLGVAAFVWAVRKGQFDDLETPAMRILFDDDPVPPREPSEAPDSAKEAQVVHGAPSRDRADRPGCKEHETARPQRTGCT